MHALVGAVFAVTNDEPDVTGRSKFLNSWTGDLLPSDGRIVSPFPVAMVVDLSAELPVAVGNVFRGGPCGPSTAVYRQVNTLHTLLGELSCTVTPAYVIWPRIMQTLIQPLYIRSKTSAESARMLTGFGGLSQIDPTELMYRNTFPTAADRFAMTTDKMLYMLGVSWETTTIEDTLLGLALAGKLLK